MLTDNPGIDDVLRNAAVERFLIHEAELLSDQRFEEWLELFTDDVVYRMPIRVWRETGEDPVDAVGNIYNETKQTLGVRIARLGTKSAWAERPPSVVRYFISNLATHVEDNGDVEAAVNLLVARSRGPESQATDYYSLRRVDLLRPAGGSFRIARRYAVLDAISPQSHNLAFFV